MAAGSNQQVGGRVNQEGVSMDEKNGFEDLKIWQLSHGLTLQIYQLTRRFPDDERYGLTSQIRRSMSSVPANIVEGRGRATKKEYIQFLYIARGSLEETKYHLILAKDLQYITGATCDNLMDQCKEIGRMINGLINSLYRRGKKF